MRILASNPDTIGDVVLRQPMYAALAEAGHELLLIVQARVFPLAPIVAPAARVLELPLNPYDANDEKKLDDLQSLFESARAFHPDLILFASCQWTLFEERLAAAFPEVPVIGMTGWLYPGSAHDGLRHQSSVRFARQVEVEHKSHELEKNRATEAILERPVPRTRPVLQATNLQHFAAKLTLRQMGLAKNPYWIACVGEDPGNWYKRVRNWRTERWAQALSHAVERFDWRFLLIGSSDEQATSHRIRDAMGAAGANAFVLEEPEGGIDLVLGAIALAEGYIGRDTGPMHLAAALGKPVIAVFGGGTWPCFTPAAETARVITLEAPCHGCQWLCHLPESYCVKEVAVEPVLAAIEEMHAGQRGECRITVLPRSAELAARMERESAAAFREQLRDSGRSHRELAQAQGQLEASRREIEYSLRLDDESRKKIDGLSEQLNEAQQERGRLHKELRQLHDQLPAIAAQVQGATDRAEKAESELASVLLEAERLRADQERSSLLLQETLAGMRSLDEKHERHQKLFKDDLSHLASVHQATLSELVQARDENARLYESLQKALSSENELSCHVRELLSSRWRKIGRKVGLSRPASFEREAS